MRVTKLKILVTGGAGFIGSHVVDALVEDGHDLVVLDNLSSGNKRNVNLNAKFYDADLRDKEKVKEIFEKEKIEVVYHLAAQIDVRKSVEDSSVDAEVNILGSLNLLELCREYGIKHFIFSSTGGAIYGDLPGEEIPTGEGSEEKPVSPYGCAKLSIEKYLHFFASVHGLKFTALRYANVYGERQNPHGEAGVVAIFINKMLKGENPKVFGGEQTRDFVYVGDVARANVLALKKRDNGIFNVGTGDETSVNILFEKINSLFGGEYKAIKEKRKNGEQLRSCLNFGKIQEELGWKPEENLDSGLKKTVKWFKSNSVEYS